MSKIGDREINWNLLGWFIGLLIGVLCYAFAPTNDGALSGYVGIFVGIFSALLVANWLLTMKCTTELAESSKLLALSKARLDDLLKGRDGERGLQWAELNSVVRTSGQNCYLDYSSKFEPHDHGFDVRGEEWSLSAYQRVWEQLVEDQKLRHDQKRSQIVVRATHSNDIAIWGDKAEQLLNLQKDFIDHGGVVVRLLIHQDETGLEQYENIQKRMSDRQVEARLCRLMRTDEVSYDFLWACDNEKDGDMHCVVKWYPGAGGLRLAACKITDLVDDEVRRMWRLFAYRSEAAEGPFKTIPPDRRTV
jgi:hypothetical protein